MIRLKEEIAFVLSSGRRVIALECKLSSREAAAYSPPRSAQRVPGLRHVVVSADGGPARHGVEHVGLAELHDFLLDALD